MLKFHRFRHAALAALATVVTLTSVARSAVVSSLSDIQFWVGTGSNQAALVIDWNDGTAIQSFAWGFRWDGAATGETMFKAIAGKIGTDTTPATSDGTGDIALNLFIKTFDFGDTVFEVDYLDHARGGFEPESAGYWGYYAVNGTANLPTTWTYAETGFADRVLVNNSWDGWSWAADFTATAPSVPMAAAVPEPASVFLIGLGLLVTLVHVKRRLHAA